MTPRRAGFIHLGRIDAADYFRARHASCRVTQGVPLMATKKSNRSSSKMGSMKRKTSRRRTRKHTSMSMHGDGSQSASITGTFSGAITAAGHLHIASGAKCQATVNASTVQVDGTVKGRLVAQNRMKLGSKAQIQGEIVADKLVASDGASFFGVCKLGRMRKAA
jgi:cytoskeletal protein CcmA (bactofilin family)